MSQAKISNDRIFNFSSGPAMLPLPVLERAREELLSVQGSGMSVMEISHRSKIFDAILENARQGIKDILSVPDNYQILFLQGGASLQFNMVPMNFLAADKTGEGSADFVVTGIWGKKAAAEARRCGKVNIIFDSEKDGFTATPKQEELLFGPGARYVHYVSNETIDGIEFRYDLD